MKIEVLSSVFGHNWTAEPVVETGANNVAGILKRRACAEYGVKRQSTGSNRVVAKIRRYSAFTDQLAEMAHSAPEPLTRITSAM